MEKPHSFAGKVVHKYGKTSTNDYAQPEKFFVDMADYLRLLDGIPFSAVEDLENYELNRDVMLNLIRRTFKILEAAKIDVVEALKVQEEDPFEGLEEDLAIKKQNAIKISGEE